MISSPLYWHPWIYKTGMQLLHHGRFNLRFERVTEWIFPGASVLDVCCGLASLEPYARAKNCRYAGLEWNPTFVNWLTARGLDVRRFDLRTDSLPASDVVVMMGSLYQFSDEAERIFEKLRRAAGRRLIIMEAVHHMSDSPFAPARFIAKLFTRTREGRCDFRFTPDSFLEFAAPRGPVHTEKVGRDYLAVWDSGPLGAQGSQHYA